MLESRGYDNRIANDGSAAMNRLCVKTSDLFFMDGHMAVLGGYDRTRKIGDELELNTPIIGATAGVTKNDKKKFLDAGMNEILAKPLLAEDVHQLAERWLKHTANQ